MKFVADEILIMNKKFGYNLEIEEKLPNYVYLILRKKDIWQNTNWIKIDWKKEPEVTVHADLMKKEEFNSIEYILKILTFDKPTVEKIKELKERINYE